MKDGGQATAEKGQEQTGGFSRGLRLSAGLKFLLGSQPRRLSTLTVA